MEDARALLSTAAARYPCSTIFSAWGKLARKPPAPQPLPWCQMTWPPPSYRPWCHAPCRPHPPHPLRHVAGKLEERQGNLLTASELYEKGARSGAGRDDASYLWHSLGSVLLQQRQLPRALEAFTEGLSRTPSSSQLLLGAAIVHSQQGGLSHVLAATSSSHPLTCPLPCLLNGLRSSLSREAGKFESARALFLKSVQADPSHVRSAALPYIGLTWPYLISPCFSLHEQFRLCLTLP